MNTNPLDRLFTITCAKCQKTAPALEWRERPLQGELPENEYQCPHCGESFRREKNPDQTWHYRQILLTPTNPRL